MYLIRIAILIGKYKEIRLEDEICREYQEAYNAIVKVEDCCGYPLLSVTIENVLDMEEACDIGKSIYYKTYKLLIHNKVPIIKPLEFTLKNHEERYYHQNTKKSPSVIEVDEHFGVSILRKQKNTTIKFKHSCVNAELIRIMMRKENLCSKMSDNLKKAYSFFNDSCYTEDIKISFLLKIIIVESLVATRTPSSESYIELIDIVNDRFLKFDTIRPYISGSNAEILPKNINSLRSRIGDFKNESIGAKCTKLIEMCDIKTIYNGKNAKTFWNECYKLRSDLVHQGEEHDNLNEYNESLHHLIIEILVKYEDLKLKL